MANTLTFPDCNFQDLTLMFIPILLLHDRDGKYTAHFDRLLNESGVKTLPLPPESPNLNAYAERFVRTVKEKCLSRMIITSEEQLRNAVKEYVEYYHHERGHQGIGNVIPFPRPEDNVGSSEGKIRKKSRLGNLLNSYFRVKNEPKPLQPQEKSRYLNIFILRPWPVSCTPGSSSPTASMRFSSSQTMFRSGPTS